MHGAGLYVGLDSILGRLAFAGYHLQCVLGQEGMLCPGGHVGEGTLHIIWTPRVSQVQGWIAASR